MEFGKQIRVMRGVRGVGQRELSKRLRLQDASILSHIETGKSVPTPALRERIKAALGWPEPPLDELAFSIIEGMLENEADLVAWLDGKAIVRIPFVEPPVPEQG